MSFQLYAVCGVHAVVLVPAHERRQLRQLLLQEEMGTGNVIEMGEGRVGIIMKSKDLSGAL